MVLSTKQSSGFTLIELMVVMSIVALLLTMVGPLAINSLEKAQAKQEMLSLKNWFRKVSARAFTTGKSHVIQLSGKQVNLYVNEQKKKLLESVIFDSLFFQPQTLTYNNKGFVTPDNLTGTYRGKPLTLELKNWVNGQQIESLKVE